MPTEADECAQGSRETALHNITAQLAQGEAPGGGIVGMYQETALRLGATWYEIVQAMKGGS